MSSLRNPSTSSTSAFNPYLLAQFALLILALMGFFGVLLATRWGAGTSPDSVVYIVGARSLAAGRGFSISADGAAAEAITHHAPFYSAALAVIDLFGPDPLLGARWLNALLFFGNILLVGYLVLDLLQERTTEAYLAAILAAGLILSPIVWVEIHSMAWSEALFILLGLSGLWSLSRYLDRSETRYLVGAALMIALASLTRYIGVVLIAAGVLSILLFSSRRFRHRLFDAASFGLIAFGPLGLWLLRNSLVAGTAVNREFFFHPISRQQIGWALTTLGSWFLIPADRLGPIKALPYLAFSLLIAAVVISRHRQSAGWLSWLTLANLPALIRILLLFVPLYLAFLLASLTFLDANTPLDSRILSPLHAAGVILAVYFLHQGLKWLGKLALLRFALLGAGFVFLAASARPSLDFIRNSYADGIGFTSRWWRESPTLAALRHYPADQAVYTNAPEALYLYTQRPVLGVPKKYESANQRPNEQYEAELLELKERLLSQGGIIVYFDPMLRSTLPSAREIQETLGLDVLEQTADGVIYGIKEQNSTDLWQPSV
jgi:hypothetical protein